MPALDYGDGLIYARCGDIATVLRVPPSTIRRWAYEDRWLSKRIRGNTYYLVSAAERSYRARNRARRNRHADKDA